MSYTVIQGSHGPRYMKDSRFVKKADIPADILIKLDVGMKEVMPETEAKEPKTHLCVFCGMGTKQYRLLNQKAIYVCENDYYNKTIGQVAQEVRRQENG